MNKILKNNVKALMSGVNEPLANAIKRLMTAGGGIRNFTWDKGNIFDVKRNILVYEDSLKDALERSIIEQNLRYPILYIYGIASIMLLKKLKNHYKTIFVFEGEIELFALALSVLDLSKELSKGSIYLIHTKEAKSKLQLMLLFNQKSIYEWLGLYELFVSMPYYEQFYELDINHTRKLCLELIEAEFRSSSQDDLYSFTQTHLLNNIPTMSLHIPFKSLIVERKNLFDVAIVVSAGPSLHKQLPLLKQYQDKACIFCADGALNILENEGITPDYITNLDFENHPLAFFQSTKTQGIFCLDSCTHPQVVELLNKKALSIILNLNYSNQRLGLDDFGYIDTGSNVSHFSYTLALELGFKTIILIGQDLAYDEKGNSHSKGFALGDRIESELDYPSLEVLAYGGLGSVRTHFIWNDYKMKLEYLFACNSEKAKFYNATQGGVRINYTEELPFEECCKRFLTRKKPDFTLPKPLAPNKSQKLLEQFHTKLAGDYHCALSFLNDAKNLQTMLEQIQNAQKELPLAFLQGVYASIDKFNQALNTNEFFYMEYFRSIFLQRGLHLSRVLILKLEDESSYILHYIQAYAEWLLKFIPILEQQLEKISKILML
ncbi:motility associated factor glycosyltransferase family protein [Campylobacter sp. VTCC 70190]|uniref:motility associated factor glycosyltransferase family protein n=1 Tax=Campylobacter sp. VTCC 70190 TaxID=3392118 RepID=UPI00398E7215